MKTTTLFALLILVAVGLTACGPKESCSVQSQEYISGFESVGIEWDEAALEAGLLDGTQETSSLIVPELERLQTMLDDLERPACADDVHAQGMNYLDIVIEANILRALGRSSAEIDAAFAIANEAQLEFVNELNKLKSGEPPYDE